MKIQVIFSSLSGNTKKLAQGIFDGLKNSNKSLHDLSEGVPVLDGDIILLGYWVDKGGPNNQMKEIMKQINNKVVGVFCTLAYFVDTTHGRNSLVNGIDELKENNTILGSYVCNGKLSDALIERFRKAPVGEVHSANKQSEIRWEIMKDHPTKLDIALAVERFNERIKLYELFSKDNLEYKSLI